MMKLIMFMFMLNFIIIFFKNFMNLMLSNLICLMFLMLMLNINFNNYWMIIYSNFGMDKISLFLILLVMWIFYFSLMLFIKKKIKLYLVLLMFLMMILILCFLNLNFFMFYLYYEISLIPTFLLILGWGYQPERLKASLYMIIYTLFFSLPLLFFIYIILNFLNLLMLMNFKEFINFKILNFLIYLNLMLPFLVKLPMFLLHNWLPKAHVEAPVVGSVVLAAIMLKLGGYGILRMLNLLNYFMNEFNSMFMVLMLFSMLILSMLNIRHLDLKVIVAYSSVIHMSMMMIGYLSMKNWGMNGGYVMMLAHGITSSSLFILLNFFYERSSSRNLLINKGLNYFFPSLMILWFLMCMNNMAIPISLNLLSEMMIINVFLNWNINLIMLMIISMFFSAMYNIYMFSFSYHGKFINNMIKIFNNYSKEYYIILMHYIPLNLMILKLMFI